MAETEDKSSQDTSYPKDTPYPKDSSNPLDRLQDFVDRKRPALEGLVEDQLGRASQLDEFLSTHLPPESRIASEEEQDGDGFQPT